MNSFTGYKIVQPKLNASIAVTSHDLIPRPYHSSLSHIILWASGLIFEKSPVLAL